MIDTIFTLSRHFLKIYNRPYIRSFLQQTDLNNRFAIIVGQRGVGKSTTLIQHLLKYSRGDFFSTSILYVQADHFITSQYTLYEIAEEFTKYGGELICFYTKRGGRSPLKYSTMMTMAKVVSLQNIPQFSTLKLKKARQHAGPF